MSPAARKLMEEYNISNPQTVPATGPHGMINKGWDLIHKLSHSCTCKIPPPSIKSIVILISEILKVKEQKI